MSDIDKELQAAYDFGVARSKNNDRLGRKHRFGYKPTSEQQHHAHGLAAAAECLVAKKTGQKWNSCGFVPDDELVNDVGNGISVRHTTYTNGSLIVHEDEPSQLRCVLVVGELREMRVIGWIYVGEAQKPAHWRTDVRHPAYFYRGPFKPIEELSK